MPLRGLVSWAFGLSGSVRVGMATAGSGGGRGRPGDLADPLSGDAGPACGLNQCSEPTWGSRGYRRVAARDLGPKRGDPGPGDPSRLRPNEGRTHTEIEPRVAGSEART